MKQAQIPQELTRFFWDTKVGELDVQAHKMFILERLLEEGNSGAVRWILNEFSPEDIENVIRTSRRIRLKTALFWKNRLGITKSILCMQKPSTLTPAEPWRR